MQVYIPRLNWLLRRIGLTLCFWLSAALLTTSVHAQDKTPYLGEEAEKTLELMQEDFDDSLKDLGELAGEVFACIQDEASVEKHEGRVEAIYSELIKLFGSERGFIFAAYFGYGAASELGDDVCEELVDEFEDQYGAISEKYELID